MTEQEDVSSVKDVLALSESMVAKERQEGVVDTLSNPDKPFRFSHLKRKEPKQYAMAVYLLEDIRAIETWEENGGEYEPPDMDPYLINPDLDLRTSQDGFLVKVFKSISHLTEGSSSGGGRIGFFGRKKT